LSFPYRAQAAGELFQADKLISKGLAAAGPSNEFAEPPLFRRSSMAKVAQMRELFCLLSAKEEGR